MNTNTPPTIKGAISAAGTELANVGQGIRNFGAQAKSTYSQIAQSARGANPYSLKGMYKKAKRK